MKINNFNFIIKISPLQIILSQNIIFFFLNIILFINFKIKYLLFISIFLNFFIIYLLFININNLNYLFNYINFNFFSIINFNNLIFNFLIKFIFNLNLILTLNNSIILILSSLTSILILKKNKNFNFIFFLYLNLSLILSLYFILIQFFEFKFFYLNFSNSIYFSNFFFLTSFHLFHVLIGILLIKKIKKIKFNFIIQINYKIKLLFFFLYNKIFINIIKSIFNFQLKSLIKFI